MAKIMAKAITRQYRSKKGKLQDNAFYVYRHCALFNIIHRKMIEYKALQKAGEDLTDYILKIDHERKNRPKYHLRFKVLPRSYGYILIDIDNKEAEPLMYANLRIEKIDTTCMDLYKLTNNWKRYLNEDYYPLGSLVNNTPSEKTKDLYNYCDFLAQKGIK